MPSSKPAGLPVTIITAGYESGGIEATGIVTGVTDANASCTITASKGDLTLTATGTVNPSGENTYCPLLAISGTALSSGTWQVTLSYDGAQGTGTSSAQAVVVP